MVFSVVVLFLMNVIYLLMSLTIVYCHFRLAIIKENFLPFMGITWISENSVVAAVSFWLYTVDIYMWVCFYEYVLSFLLLWFWQLTVHVIAMLQCW